MPREQRKKNRRQPEPEMTQSTSQSGPKPGEYTPYTKTKEGVTHDARGNAVELNNQVIYTYRGKQVDAGRIRTNSGKSLKEAGTTEFKDKNVKVHTDPGWDDYNKVMREMRHRVSSQRKAGRRQDQKRKLGKFGTGSATAASGRRQALTSAAATLYDD